MHKERFKTFLKKENLTDNGINARVNRCRRVEKDYSVDLDDIVKSDKQAHNLIADIKNNNHYTERVVNVLPNAVRKYYIYVNNKELPRLECNSHYVEGDPIEAEADILPEGAKKKILVNKYERSAKSRSKCIKYYGVSCQICNLNFKNIYGSLGSGFIQIHHKKLISELGENYKVDPIKDLIPVCPNCHAMLHRQQGITLSIEELKKIIVNTEINNE